MRKPRKRCFCDWSGFCPRGVETGRREIGLASINPNAKRSDLCSHPISIRREARPETTIDKEKKALHTATIFVLPSVARLPCLGSAYFGRSCVLNALGLEAWASRNGDAQAWSLGVENGFPRRACGNLRISRWDYPVIGGTGALSMEFLPAGAWEPKKPNTISDTKNRGLPLVPNGFYGDDAKTDHEYGKRDD